ncbi:MAG: hypothetical protein IPJ69_00225 [Deltaproteobacteria bacterium]|nr:MAG: hypothetical protein IPJ69_00225 [Deltaproteobacteria bacterium]
MTFLRPSLLTPLLAFAGACGSVPDPLPRPPRDASTLSETALPDVITTDDNTCYRLVDAGCSCREPRVTRSLIDVSATGTTADRLSARHSIRLSAQMPVGAQYAAVFFKVRGGGREEEISLGWMRPVTSSQRSIEIFERVVYFDFLKRFEGGILEASVYAISGSAPIFIPDAGTFVNREEALSFRNCVSLPTVVRMNIPRLPDNINAPDVSDVRYQFGMGDSLPRVHVSFFHEGPRLRSAIFRVDPTMLVGEECREIPPQDLSDSGGGSYSLAFTLSDPRCQLEHVDLLVGSLQLVFSSVEGGEGTTLWDSFAIRRAAGDPSPTPLPECIPLRVPPHVELTGQSPYQLDVTTPVGTSLIQVIPNGLSSCSPTPFFTRGMTAMATGGGFTYRLLYQPEPACAGSFSTLSVRTFILGCDTPGNAEVPIR